MEYIYKGPIPSEILFTGLGDWKVTFQPTTDTAIKFAAFLNEGGQINVNIGYQLSALLWSVIYSNLLALFNISSQSRDPPQDGLFHQSKELVHGLG